MGNEGTVLLDLLVQSDQSIPVSINGEVVNDPHDNAKEVDDRPDVVEDRAWTLNPKVHDRQSGLLSGCSRQLRVPSRSGRLGTHHELPEFAHGMGSNLLREERPSGSEDAGDLGPARIYGVSRRHEVDRCIGEGEDRVVRVGSHDVNAEGLKAVPRDGHVRPPPFNSNGQWSEARQTTQQLAATRLEIQHRRGSWRSLRNEVEVVPGGALFERATHEPGEVPTMDWCALCFSDELLERTFHRMQSVAPRTVVGIVRCQ